MNKKLIGIITALVVVLVLVVGGIVGYNMYRNNQIEKQYNELQSQYDKATDLAKKSVEHIVSADESKLATYKDKIADKKMSEKDMKAFAKTVKAIDKAYADSKTECEKLHKETVSLYDDNLTAEGEDFYTEDLVKEYDSLVAEYQKAFDKGNYRTAYVKITEASTKITQYVRTENAKAEEEANEEKTESNSSNNSSKPSGSNNTASNENNGGNNNVPAPPSGSGSSPVFSMSDFPTEESFNAYREQNIHKWKMVDEFGNDLGGRECWVCSDASCADCQWLVNHKREFYPDRQLQIIFIQ